MSNLWIALEINLDIRTFFVFYDGVRPRSPFLRLVFVLCAFAVLGAQIFGLSRRFICDCGGEMEVVKFESCTGPHGANCHDEYAQQFPCSEDQNDGDPKQHDQVKEHLKSTMGTAPQVVVPAPVIFAVLPELLRLAPGSLELPIEYWAEAYSIPPPGIAVARTVVLLL